MPFPLAAVGLGLNVLSSLSGLIGGNRAAKAAQEAEQMAIRGMEQSGEDEFGGAYAAGQRNLYGLTGQLNEALGRSGRGLGAAMAGAGVGNSSATAGALVNLEASNAANIRGYSENLADTLSRIRSGVHERIANMRYGIASSNLNSARQQQAGSIGGIASLLGKLGQFDQAQQGVVGANKTGMAGQGMSNASLIMPGQPGDVGMEGIAGGNSLFTPQRTIRPQMNSMQFYGG